MRIMRYLFCLLFFPSLLQAQTINPEQIRPSTNNQWVLTTAGGQTQWAPSQGLTAIIPGTNITCTPNFSGICTGTVTINSSGGGGGGSYWDSLLTPAGGSGASSYFVSPNLIGIVTGQTTEQATNANQNGSIFDDFRPFTRPAAAITATAVAGNVVTVTAANAYFDNDRVLLEGLTSATYLNGQYVTLTGANSSAFTFNFTHTSYSTTADTGTAINQFGTFGTRFTNCASATGSNYENNLPFTIAISTGCQTNFAYENWAVSPNQSHGAAAVMILDSTTEYPGYDIGNPGFLANSDTGWAGSLGVGINSVSYSSGIRNTLTLSYNCFAAGDCNPFELTGIADGGYGAASDQGITPFGLNTSQTASYVQTSIAGTSGFGDTNPTFNSLGGNHFTPGSPAGGFVLDTQTAVASGTMLTGGGFYQTGGALNMFVLGNGSGMIPNPTFTITAVASSGGGSTTYTGTFGICGSNACAQSSLHIAGFVGSTNNGNFLITASSTTSVTVNNGSAVAESHAATGTMSYAVICTGGGGSGMTGWTVTVNFTGDTNTNPGSQVGDLIGNPGAGYTSVPSCIISSLANSGSSTLSSFSAELTSTLHTLPIAGASLTPSTGTAILSTYMFRSAVDMVNQSYSISVTIESGAMSASTNGGRIWIASDPTPEMCQITAAGSVVGITQALTVSCHLPHPTGSLIFQGGTSDFICLDAQAAGTASLPSWPFCTYAYGAADSTHIIYGWLVQGTQVNGVLPEVGNMRASFASGSNGWHIYKGAQVLSTINQGTVPTLNVNDVNWAVNDAVSQPMPPSYNSGSILAEDIAQSVLTPNGGGQMALLRKGESMSSGYTSFQIKNENQYGAYQGCDVSSTSTCLPFITAGGPLTGPTGMSIFGPFRNVMALGVPLTGGALITVPDGPTTPDYALFSDNSGAVGAILIQPTAHNVAFSHSLSAGSSIFAGSNIQSGSGLIANTTVTAPQGWIVGNPSIGTAQIFENNQSVSQHVFFPIGYVTASSIPPFLDTTAWLSMGELYSGTVYAGSPPPFSIGTFVATPGSTSYSWVGKCVTQNGESLPATTSITNGPAAITAINFVNIKAFASPGCQSINIYRTSTSGGLSAGLLGNVTVGGSQTITDSGQAPSGPVTANVDTSGSLYASTIVDGALGTGTSPVCPNGAGGALTTSGCSGGGGSFITSLTTTGSSGAATVSGGVLNIPVYSGGGAVSSVSNSDSTLTVSPTTGAVVASLNLAHANTWTGQQTFNSGGANQIQIGTNVFSALAACTSGVEGTQAPVTDSTTNTWGATITGGGSDHVLAYCDGSAWTVAAK